MQPLPRNLIGTTTAVSKRPSIGGAEYIEFHVGPIKSAVQSPHINTVNTYMYRCVHIPHISHTKHIDSCRNHCPEPSHPHHEHTYKYTHYILHTTHIHTSTYAESTVHSPHTHPSPHHEYTQLTFHTPHTSCGISLSSFHDASDPFWLHCVHFGKCGVRVRM